jgi:hypothetical protein
MIEARRFTMPPADIRFTFIPPLMVEAEMAVDGLAIRF